MGLEAGMWASRLKFERGAEKKKEKKEREKIHHMCESKGHPPLRYLSQSKILHWQLQTIKTRDRVSTYSLLICLCYLSFGTLLGPTL